MNEDDSEGAIEEAVRRVRRSMTLHHRKIVCRALMWDGVIQAVTAENVCRVLNALAADEQRYLQSVYEDFPPSLWSLRSPDEGSHCAAIEQWCQQPPSG